MPGPMGAPAKFVLWGVEPGALPLGFRPTTVLLGHKTVAIVPYQAVCLLPGGGRLYERTAAR